MDQIESHLHQAIEMANNHSRHRVKKSDRDRIVNTLNNDIVRLDGMTHPQRKNTIVAIQNVLQQLDHLYDSDKPAIMIPPTASARTSYLPENRESSYALGNAFITNSYSIHQDVTMTDA